MILSYELIPDSCGAGQFRGGLGVRRVYKMNTPVEFGIAGERMKSQPWGRLGGQSGRSSNYYTIINGKESTVQFSKAHGRLPAGGGGIGDPHTRDIEACFQDWLDERISLETLQDKFGISIVNGQPYRGTTTVHSHPGEDR